MEKTRGFLTSDILRAIAAIEHGSGSKLSNTQRILLTTDGSVTRILESITNQQVVVVARTRETIKADEKTAKMLGIRPRAQILYRVVDLKNVSSPEILIRARSWTPRSRRKFSGYRDVVSANIPIGKIIAKNKLETRREITSLELLRADEELSRAFKTLEGDYVLSRHYNIIHDRSILIRINELFPLSKFTEPL